MRRLLATAWPCAILLLLAGSLRSPAVASSDATAGRPEWQVLTRANFSSQIRLHPHVLLLATMPFDISGKTLTRESDVPLELVIEDEELTFGGGSQLTSSPWKAREYFLPPEMARFGLITERSLLPSLDVVNEGNLDTYFVIIHYLGCTTCSVIAKEGDDLRSLVQSHHNLSIKEVGADESGARLSAWASKLMALGDKMSVMVVNDGDSISYRSSSQDDSKIQVVESLSVEDSEYKRTDNSVATSDNSNDDTTEVSVDENTAKETEYIDDGQAPKAEDESKSEASDMSPDLQEEVPFNAYSSSEVGALDKKFRKIEHVIYENTFNLDEASEESDTRCPHHATCSPSRDDTDFTEQVTSSISDDRFAGSFYFSDGGYRLLKTLTGGSRIPSLNYLDSFMNQSLPSYYRVTSSATSSKELPRPPFVNHDFHEANSIPHNSWCGFCQRAELVVRFMLKKRMATQHDAPQAIQLHISDKGSGNVGYDLPNHSDVVAGSILTATEKLGTTVPFDNAEVLIVSSDSHQGFHGLIINKRLSWGVFKNLDSSMESIKHAPLFYGGPVVVQGYHLVSLSKVAWEGYVQVIPGVYYGNIIATSRVVTRIKSGEQSVDDLWFFLGYSGWVYGQLFDELSEGAWLVSGKPIEHLDWPES
ncbi:hypothetical protein BAE44_0006265 [Dichanthelium oligosanthes]|uniref:Uncharacterized protein n=1 Tax=Dichanthelium oligosanthes TaxID=888268 RepID=A0A1E5W5Q3_9POAL|nr:hypothetical protein BAE44_0006265 [Dichanthelium oligosanthes]